MPLIKGESNLDYCYEEFPKCPHCDFLNEEWWDGTTLKSNDDTEKRSCISCGEEYEVTMHVSYRFSTDFVKEKENG